MNSSPEAFHLGVLRSTYSVNWLLRGALSGGALVFIGLCAVSVLYDLSIGGSMGFINTCLSVIALILLVFTIYHGAQAMQASLIRINVHEYGIAYRDGRHVSAILWDEIETVWYVVHIFKIEGVIPVRVRYDLRLHLNDGDILSIPRQPGRAEQLAEVIGQGVAASRMPRALERIAQGEQLVFGEYRVDKNGFTAGDMVVPWEQQPCLILDGMYVRLILQGNVALTRKSHFDMNIMGKVPNLHLLFALVEALSAQARIRMGPV
jgi:hypothetical protein